MKKLILLASVAVMSFTTINKSVAATISCISGLREDGITTCEKCGDNCNWKIEDGTLEISGTGVMRDYTMEKGKTQKENTYHHIWEDYKTEITAVKVEGVEYIGKGSFSKLSNLSQVDIGNSVKTIGFDAFWYNENLKSVVIPDSVEEIQAGAFSAPSTVIPPLNEITIADSLQKINLLSFGYNLNIEIICVGNIQKCQKLVSKYTNDEGKVDLSSNVIAADENHCAGTNYYWNGASCVKKDEEGNVTCASGFVEWDNACVDEYPFAKKRWTPAEANEWLHDGNDNFVVITFKK